MGYLVCHQGTVNLLLLQILLEMKTPFIGKVTLKVSRPAELTNRPFVQLNNCFGLKKVVRLNNSSNFNFSFIPYVLFKNKQLHGNHHMCIVNTKEVNMSWLVSQLVNVTSVDRALHQNHSGQGSSSCTSLNLFFLALFSLLFMVIVWRI